MRNITKKRLEKTDNLFVALLIISIDALVEKLMMPLYLLQKAYYKAVVVAQRAQQ